jgi:hypothetical protein
MNKVIGILSLLFICLIFSGCSVEKGYDETRIYEEREYGNFYSKEGCQNQCSLRGFDKSKVINHGYRNTVCHCVDDEGILTQIYEW